MTRITLTTECDDDWRVRPLRGFDRTVIAVAIGIGDSELHIPLDQLDQLIIELQEARDA